MSSGGNVDEIVLLLVPKVLLLRPIEERPINLGEFP